MSLLTPTGSTQRDISNRQAVFKTLSYSALFDDKSKINEINGADPDKRLTYGQLLYKLDNNGNLIPDGNGAYELKPEVKKDAFISSFLNKNSNLATDLLHYQIDQVVHSDDGLVATAVVDTKHPETAYLTARGSTAGTVKQLWDDWAKANTKLAANEYVTNFEIAQVVDFENFIKDVQTKFNYETINPGGHSKSGYLTQMGTAYVLKYYPDVLGQADSFNGPVATRAIGLRYGEEYVQKTLEVTNLHMTTGDIVSEVGNVLGNVDGKFLIYNSISDNPSSHTSLSFSELDMSTFYTDYFEGGIYAVDQHGDSIYGEPVVNVEKWTQDYAKILSYEDQIRAQIDNMGSNDSDIDVLIVRAEGYLQGTIDTATFGLVSFGPYAELDKIKDNKQHMENLLKGVYGLPTIENNALATKEYITESLGGAENVKLLNSIADVTINGLSSETLHNSYDKVVNITTLLFSSAEKLDASDREQFVNSLQRSDLIDNLFGVEGSEDVTLDSIISDKFIDANTQLYGDPLVVDLDGDGQLETRGATGEVLFDHSGDGQATGTGWVNAEDGLLVRDLDGSNTIDSGRELFGDNTIKSDGTKAKDGFDALSDLDSSGDGVFDANDDAFSEVKVWQDVDQDGVTDEGELLSLADAGISSIDLNANSVNQNIEGGILRKTSTATTKDGTTTAVGAIDFAENKFYSRFADELEISPDLEGSINIAGQGALRSLHEASSLSSELNDLLTGLYSGDAPVTDSAIHEVLLEWAKSAENFTTSLELLDGYTLEDGTQINLDVSDRVKTIIEKTAVLEALNGERLLKYQITNSGGKYSVNIRTGVETSDFRIGGADVLKGSEVSLNDWDFHRLADSGRTTVINEGYANAFNSIKDSIETNRLLGEVQPFLLENILFELDDVGEVAFNFDGINDAIVEKFKADPSTGLDFYKNVVEAKEVTFLKEGWDNQSVLQNEIPRGLSEVLNAEVILNDAEKINFLVDGKLYTIGSLSGTGLADFILGTGADNNISGGNSADKIIGGSGLDKLYGNNHNDELHGEEGDDYLHGGSQSDILYGGEGDDTLIGDNIITSEVGYNRYTIDTRKLEAKYNKGDDILAGGRGNDTLAGGYGSDTYIFNKGDGIDTITEMLLNDYAHTKYDSTARDKIVFGEGLNQEDINISVDGKDLLVSFTGAEGDQLILKDFMSRTTINNFEFADGTRLDTNQLMSITEVQGTDDNDNFSGFGGVDLFEGNVGDDVISGNSGNDELSGGKGSDRLYGNNHDDSLDGGEGDDYLHGGSQSDILYGGEGDDTLIGDNIITSEVGYNRYTIDTRKLEAKYNKGDDVLAGGKGDDSLAGGYGSDIYIFNKGDGVDTITEMLLNDYAHTKYDSTARDKIVFGEGINKEDILLSLSGKDLLVNFRGSETDQLILKDFMSNNTINNFEFADGSRLDRNNFMSLDVLEGTDEADSISGYGGAEIILAGAGNDVISGNSGDDELSGGEGNDKLYGNNHNDTLDGGLGDDYLHGGNQSDVLQGGEGNDTLVGDSFSNSTYYYTKRDEVNHSGDDVLTGGKGDDGLAGGYGSDTYIFNKGDGVDTITEVLTSEYGYRVFDKSSRDTVKFGEGIQASDLNFTYDGNDVHVTFNGLDTDKLILKNFKGSTLDKFEFANGNVLNKSDIKIGTVGDDTLVGNANDNIISSGEGSDIITGGQGDDSISVSGIGNTINYNLGDGFDNISSLGEGYEGSDKVVFGKGITQEDLTYNQDGNDLIINVKGDQAQGFRLVNFGIEQGSNIGSFEFANGTFASPRDILDQMNKPAPTHIGTDLSEKIVGTNDAVDVVHAGAGDDTVYLGSGNDIADAGDGNDIIKALNGGDNTIDGGTGNDRIETGAGADRLSGGLGDDIIKAGAGDDVITGGLGNDDISGELGNNVINYNLGDGLDTIRAAKLDVTDQTDKIVFGENISQDDVLYLQRNEDLFVQVGADPEQGLLVKKFYAKSGYETKVSGFEFADGSFKAIEDIQPVTLGTDLGEKIVGTNDVVDVVHAGAGDDTVYLGSGNDIADAGDGNDIVKALNGGDNTIDGGTGNDRIETGAGSDMLSGGLGDDIIKAGAGNDVITGGQGDDILAGGAGSDTYEYSTGDGNDTINLAGDGSTDTLKLNDISKDDILISRSDNDLEINFHDQLSSLIVDDYFESQFNNDSLIIDTNDEFQMLLGANANKMAEILAANTSSDEDIDGGSVDGSNQITTQVDASQLADLWVPKNNRYV
ncbi:calcium-binding protein [Francisella sp. SYW-9]|uniref:calcium-binding protein n=2 Tax=Thiotrichales TaxID=72273 RepID=UPI00123CC731|nr:calcium-binding protein [Francisella sp. SYW-9]